MIELILVLVLTGILAVVALPKMGQMIGTSETAVRDKLKSGVQFARKVAVSARRNVCIDVFSGATSGLRFTFDPRDPDAGAAVSCTSSLKLPASDQKACGAATAGNELCLSSGMSVANGPAKLIISPSGSVTYTACFIGTACVVAAGFQYSVTGSDATTYLINVDSVAGYATTP